MRIRKIHVHNFRNLTDVSIYPSKTTIIVGENDSGKSNFLHALRLLLDPQADRLRLDLSEADISEVARKNGEYWFSVLIEIGELQQHIEVETCFKERISLEGKETFVTLEGKYEKDDQGEYTFSARVLSPAGRHNDPIPMRPRMYRSIPLYYLGALRNADRDLRTSGRTLLGQLIDEIDLTDVEDDVQSYLHSANDALNRGEDVNKLAGGITSQLTQLVPGGQSSVKLSVNDEDRLAIKRGLRLSVQKSPGSGLTDISRHGTGLQNLTLVALFRHRVANSKSGIPILAVEEPEAHIHPHAQRRLFRDLDAIDSPVIITTHSTAIVKNANPLNLVLFRSVRDSTISFQLNKAKIGDDDLSNLSQLVRGGRSELFFARAIIIVEGESELLALPSFAEVLGCDLDREGISLIDAGGNDFSYILRSCSDEQFSIPSVITYDTDVLKENNNLLREAFKSGLIDKTIRDSPDNNPGKLPLIARREILDSLGWFAAEECFEEEVCRNGYIDIVKKAIDNADPDNHSDFRAFEKFIKDNGLTANAQSVAMFIKKRKTLKTPVARAVSNAAKTINAVPNCYANAIRRAILLSQGGLTIDEYFERRSCAAGFRDLIFQTLEKQEATRAYEDFVTAEKIDQSILGLSRFFTETGIGSSIRHLLKSTIADAVEACGCRDYAEAIRNTDFPIKVG